MKTTLLKFFPITVFTALFFTNCAKPIDACFEFSPESPDTATFVTFNGGCSENAFKYKWNFGDGTPDTISDGFIVKHKYAKQGAYTVTLNAQRKDGITVRKEKPVIEHVVSVH